MGLLPLVVFHVSAGLIAILSGFVAMTYRKGSRGHRISGNTFSVSMLCMAGSATFMAFFLYQFKGVEMQITNIFAGMLTIYLVATAWRAARRRDAGTDSFDRAALLVVLTLLACYVTFGVEALRSPTGLKDGYPAFLYFVFAFIAVVSAMGDVRLLRHLVIGKYRIARHLWRMSFALFIAAGSFFLGQQRVFPASWRGAKIWFVPPLLSLILLLYWLIRVRFAKGHRRITSLDPMTKDSFGILRQSALYERGTQIL